MCRKQSFMMTVLFMMVGGDKSRLVQYEATGLLFLTKSAISLYLIQYALTPFDLLNWRKLLFTRRPFG